MSEICYAVKSELVKKKLDTRTAGARLMCFKFLAGMLVPLLLLDGQSILKSLKVGILYIGGMPQQ